jgi:hypothetical protein
LQDWSSCEDEELFFFICLLLILLLYPWGFNKHVGLFYKITFLRKVCKRGEFKMAKYSKECVCGIIISSKNEKELSKLIKKHVAKSHASNEAEG